MDQRVECRPVGLARLYFLELAGWIKDLHAAQESVCRAFSSLLDEYSMVVPRSRLQLSPRNRRLHGTTALYWAEITTKQVRSKSGKREMRAVPDYLKGDFQKDWAFTKAKRSDLVGRLVDFNRRRLALNAASSAVISAIERVRVATVRRFPLQLAAAGIKSCLDPYTVKELPEVPAELFPPGLAPRLSQFLRSGWIAAFSLALAEEEACELALEVSNNPSAADKVRIDLTDRRKPGFLRHVRWVFIPTGTTYPKLTDMLMRTLHLREGVRPVLSSKERKRRRIEKALAKSADTLDSIRKKCDEVQLVVSRGLAEAKRILLEATSQSCSAPRAAS